MQPVPKQAAPVVPAPVPVGNGTAVAQATAPPRRPAVGPPPDVEPTTGMSNLIAVINRLQDVVSAIGGDMLNLPQIAVVGAWAWVG